MSEQIREQVSAFLDGELPNSETELLLKRLTRDPELRDSFGRYALIGESMRGGGHTRLSRDFAAQVNRGIDGAPAVAPVGPVVVDSPRWWRPFAGAAVAAGVAAVAVLALQQRAVAPTLRAALPMTAVNRPVPDTLNSREPLSYTVPAAVAESPTARPAARLTNYVFAHSRYSSPLGQSTGISPLLTAADADDSVARTATPDASP